ncbi:MAG: hypothetical protein KF857_00320 [Fimbriimonadaceae bacterium]|nr:hypothetical protein [Fimbriimonadaceae bacterium]
MAATRPLTIASLALFGMRPDRDTGTYYRLLLNQLRGQTDLPMVVYTNEPWGFVDGIELVTVADHVEMARKYWAAEDWQEQYAVRLRWHPKNEGLSQFSMPHLPMVYLAKCAAMTGAAKAYGDVLWLDAGLLFSVVYDHRVPEDWQGYDRDKLDKELLAWLRVRQEERKPVFATVPRKWRPNKNHRPTFHGLSFNDMSRLAQATGARADSAYVVAGAALMLPETAATIDAEFPAVWQSMLAQGRAGTEETVLSVLRWRHGWLGVSVEEWVRRMVPDP